MVRLHPAFCALAAFAMTALIGTGALAAATDNRASLSYEDNVTINTACFTATKKGGDAFRSSPPPNGIAATTASPASRPIMIACGRIWRAPRRSRTAKRSPPQHRLPPPPSRRRQRTRRSSR